MSTKKAFSPVAGLIASLRQDPNASALFKHLAASALTQFNAGLQTDTLSVNKTGKSMKVS